MYLNITLRRNLFIGSGVLFLIAALFLDWIPSARRMPSPLIEPLFLLMKLVTVMGFARGMALVASEILPGDTELPWYARPWAFSFTVVMLAPFSILLTQFGRLVFGHPVPTDQYDVLTFLGLLLVCIPFMAWPVDIAQVGPPARPFGDRPKRRGNLLKKPDEERWS